MAFDPLTGQFIPGTPMGPTFGAGTAGFQTVDPLTGAPPTGLIGSEQALTSSADNALRVLREGRNLSIADLQQAQQQGLSALGTGRQEGTAKLGQAIERFAPLARQGTSAGDVQSALSGALGPEAQQAALANLQPVSQFLQEEGGRAVTRNAARLGGLGGGNVLRELTRFGQGLAGESAQQQFQNLGTVAERGFGALKNIGSLRGQQADIQTGIARDVAGLLRGTAQDVTQTRTGAGTNIANVLGGTGQQIAAGRQTAGQDIAGAIGGTTSALSNLLSQQGAGVSDITGAGAGALANILSGTGQTQAQQQQALAALLANLATQQGSTVAGLPGIPGITETGGILGNISGAISASGTL